MQTYLVIYTPLLLKIVSQCFSHVGFFFIDVSYNLVINRRRRRRRR